jgi:hypothetical protein
MGLVRRLRLGLSLDQFGVLRAVWVWQSRARFGSIDIRLAPRPGAGSSPPARSIARHFTHPGTAALGLAHGAVAITGAVGRADQCPRIRHQVEGSRQQDRCERNAAESGGFGVPSREKGSHVRSLRRPPKKTDRALPKKNLLPK